MSFNGFPGIGLDAFIDSGFNARKAPVSVCWACFDNDFGTAASSVRELDPDTLVFFRAMWTTRRPFSGIGGTPDVIWGCNKRFPLGSSVEVYIQEMSIVDLTQVRETVSPYKGLEGIGGDENVIWMSNGGGGSIVLEVNPTDFSIVRTATGPGRNASGIGGTEDVIWHCDVADKKVYELDPSDFSTVRFADSPGVTPEGMGGSTDRIYHSDEGIYQDGTTNDDTLYELSIVDFSVLNSHSGAFRGASGIGGM